MPGERCRQCAAALRPGAPWCTQCYVPVGAGPDRAEAPPVASAPAVVVPAHRTGSDEPPAVAVGSWPCDACGTANPLTAAACTTCGAVFLARAREGRPTLVLPLLGDVAALTPLRLVPLALVLAGALLLAALVGGALLP